MDVLGMDDELCSLLPRPWRRRRRAAVERQARPRLITQELTRLEARPLDRNIHVSEDEICFFVFDAPPTGGRRSVPSGEE
jgi:hypothetical protein